MEQHTDLSEQITDLLLKSVEKLDAATADERQELLCYFTSLLLSAEEIPGFLFDITESVIFSMPYGVLKDALSDINLEHGRIGKKIQYYIIIKVM